MKKTNLLILIFLIIIVVIPTSFLYSADTTTHYKLISEDIPFVSQVEKSGGGLFNYINAFFRLGIGVGILLAVLMFVYNGILYMTSDVIGKKAEAKSAFFNIIGGVVLILTAVLILQTINPDLVSFGLGNRLNNITPPSGENKYPNIFQNRLTTPPDGKLSYQDGIEAQRIHASPELENFLNCMAEKLPGNVGEVSSISDSYIVEGKKTWEECARGECQHRAGSLHYGGTKCVGKSYAVDFGDEKNYSFISAAAFECDRGARTLFEGNHVHISIGAASRCN